MVAPKAVHAGFPVCHFVRNYTHKLKTKGRIRTFYLLNDCTTIGDIYVFSWLELYARYHQQVMDPNTHRNHHAIRCFVHTYTQNSKTTGCMRTFYISKYCSTITDVYFLCYSWIRHTNRELRLQTHFTISFDRPILRIQFS